MIEDIKLPNFNVAIIVANNAIQFRVGQRSHRGWFVDEYGYWRSCYYQSWEIKQMLSRNNSVTYLDGDFDNHTLPYYRGFMRSPWS